MRRLYMIALKETLEMKFPIGLDGDLGDVENNLIVF